MRTKTAVFLALVVALVLGIASMAFGVETTPTLTASRTSVTYPHSARLFSTTETASVIMRRIGGTEEWVAWRTVASGLATVPVVSPRNTAGYKVVSDGVESEVVTISVAAKLSKPQINKRGHKRNAFTIKGWIAPRHVEGTVTLTFFRLEKTGETTVTVKVRGRSGKLRRKVKTVGIYEWVQSGDPVDVALMAKNSQMSKWTHRWTPIARGAWKVVVSHEDATHTLSRASAKYAVKR